jgi:hypothetical protein
MARRVVEQPQSVAKVPWTPRVLKLLDRWKTRAEVSQEAHYARSTRLATFNIWLGVPVVALTTFVATSVFATLTETDVPLELRIAVGGISALAAVLASLQTFLRFQERAEKHRASAELWASIRREIDEMLALHPEYLSERSDPQQYLDDLRRRMDEVSAQSLEIGERYLQAAEARVRVAATDAPRDEEADSLPA